MCKREKDPCGEGRTVVAAFDEGATRVAVRRAFGMCRKLLPLNTVLDSRPAIPLNHPAGAV